MSNKWFRRQRFSNLSPYQHSGPHSMSWLIELKGWTQTQCFFVGEDWFHPQLGVPEINNLSKIEAITVPSFPAGDGCNESF